MKLLQDINPTLNIQNKTFCFLKIPNSSFNMIKNKLNEITTLGILLRYGKTIPHNSKKTIP